MVWVLLHLVAGLAWNLGQNILRLFHFLVQFFFTTSETEIDYYYQKVHVQVALRVVKRLKTYDFRKLGNFKKISETLGFDGKYPAVHRKVKFWCFLVKNCKKSAVKYSIEKPILLNFVNLSPAFCPRLWNRALGMSLLKWCWLLRLSLLSWCVVAHWSWCSP